MSWDDERASRYLASQAHYDQALEVFDNALLSATNVAPGQSVLDVGCGPGSTLVKFARAVAPDGYAVGIDIAEPMVEAARRQVDALGVTNASAVCVDAQSVTLEQQPFDIVASRLGVMFFEDLAAAFENLCSMTKPRGTLAFTCWQELERGPWAKPCEVISDYLDSDFDLSPYTAHIAWQIEHSSSSCYLEPATRTSS